LTPVSESPRDPMVAAEESLEAIDPEAAIIRV